MTPIEHFLMDIIQILFKDWIENTIVMRILKLAKYRLKAQVEKDEGPSGDGQSPRVEKDEGPSGEGWRPRGKDTNKNATRRKQENK